MLIMLPRITIIFAISIIISPGCKSFESVDAEYANILPCILNITAQFAKNTNIILISEELQRLSWSASMLSNLHEKVMIQNFENLKGGGFFILFPDEDEKSYETVLKHVTPSAYNRFLIIWSSFSGNYAKLFIEQFWKYRLLNILILVQENMYYDAFTYEPYSELACNEPGPLIFLDTWDTNANQFIHGHELFPKNDKLINLHKCELICFAKTRPPDSIVYQTANGSWVLDGVGGKLMEEVRTRLNFTPIISVPKMNISLDKYGYDISYGIPEVVSTALDNFTVDLAFGIYSHIIYDDPRTEFSMSAVSECFGWAVPAHSGKEMSPWKYYTQEFNKFVWLLILFQFICCIQLLFFLFKMYYFHTPNLLGQLNYVSLYLLSITLGLSATPRVRQFKIRLLLAPIFLYSLIIVAAYQSSLGSFVTVPWKREHLKTYQDILDGNYKISGVPQSKRILQRFAADNRTLIELSKRYETHRDLFRNVLLKIQNKDGATFAAQRFIQFYIQNELNSSGREDVHLFPECVLQAHSSPFLFRKGSRLLKPINKIISSAVESGLINFWFSYSTPKIAGQFVDIYPLSMQKIKVAFVILILGNSLSTIVFVIELNSKYKYLKI